MQLCMTHQNTRSQQDARRRPAADVMMSVSGALQDFEDL